MTANVLTSLDVYSMDVTAQKLEVEADSILKPCGSPLLGVALPNSLFSEDTANAINRSCGSLRCNSLEVLVATAIAGKHQLSWRLSLNRPRSEGLWGLPLPCTSLAPGNSGGFLGQTVFFL